MIRIPQLQRFSFNCSLEEAVEGTSSLAVVTRVYPGGEKFQIFVLNDRNEAYEILYKTGEIKSNN